MLPPLMALLLMATTGLVPLNDLGTGVYEGFPGGLYPGGANHPPVQHFAAAMQRAAQIVPRNASGAPDPSGFIVMIAVGMSNTTHEFAVFEREEDGSRGRNPRVLLVDTALGGQTAQAIASPSASYWTVLQQRLSALGLTAAQVQVAWLKEADAHPPDDFPVHAQTLRDELELVANNLHAKFPNLRLCYLSSRIYGGYAQPGSLNPEPQAYESGFSVKWLIEDQILGDPGLSYGLPGEVRAPLLLWGPYLWADGTNPRSDGLTWELSDFEGDHTHPGPQAEAKVAGLLSSFFASEATAVPWWPARREDDLGIVWLDATKDAHVSAASPGTNFGASTQLLAQGGGSPSVIHLGFDAGGVARPVALAKLSARVAATGGGFVSSVSDTSWAEDAITWNDAPPLGAPLVQMPQSSRDGTIGAGVTAAVNGDADAVLGFALTTPTAGQTTYRSKEAGEPPRLVLLVSCAASPDADGDGRGDPCDCAPMDGATFSAPREVDGLRWTAGDTLGWASQAISAGSGIRYDVMSGDLSTLSSFDPRPGDLCLGSGLTATQAIDATPSPSPGEGRFYLVRAVNACGTSRWETASDGRDRQIAACP